MKATEPVRRANTLRVSPRIAHAGRMLGTIFVLSIYFSAAPFGYAAFAALQLLPSKDPERRALILQSIIRRAFAMMHVVLRRLHILHYDPREVLGSFPTVPSVLVANHPTLTDTSALFATIPRITSAVKPRLFRSYWARPLLKQAAMFEGSLHDPAGVERMIESAVDRLHRGYHVIVFPEGTRSPKSGLHNFGRSAFEIAVKANVPVVPIAIRCEPRWLSKDRSFFAPPEQLPRLSLEILDALLPSSFGHNSRDLRKTVVTAIANHLFPENLHTKSLLTQRSD